MAQLKMLSWICQKQDTLQSQAACVIIQTPNIPSCTATCFMIWLNMMVTPMLLKRVLWKGMQVSSEEYAENSRIPTKSLGLLAENRKEKHYNHLQCSGYHEMVVLCSTGENFQVLYYGVLSCACPY
ncbi:uncharacterized protein G2W53_041475 [Senna tora]|uniref:Uncharacterized protein n=1 Tax=Senna tora TaxID=362788 RepID=A0A834SS70_9FABA|nr:uncharacterized protein G2W53_041475 [Senna tora]